MTTPWRKEAGAPSRPERTVSGARLAELPSVSRSDQVADSVRAAILSGQLAPGDQLKQDELRSQLGVSPSPIREALRQLESEGLVAHYPNRGVFVASVSPEELVGVLLPVRLALERYAVMQILPALPGKLVAELRGLVEAMERGAAAGDQAMVYEADVEFHERLVVSSGAYHTIQLWRAVQPRVRVMMYQLGPRHHSIAEITAEHDVLLKALIEGDPVQVGRMLEEHIIGDSERMLAQGLGRDARTE